MSEPVQLLVASEPREFSSLLKRCSGVRKQHWPVKWARSARLNGRAVWLVANGVGPRHARRAVEVAGSLGTLGSIVSMGFCGALDPKLAVGDVFTAEAIGVGERRIKVNRPICPRPHASGILASVPYIAQTASEKARLRMTGAAAVEMEAAGIAESAGPVPLFCIRAVTDLAGESFACNFTSALREDGHFDTIRLLSMGLRRPAQVFPELLRLRSRCQIAARSLGDFIADCRF